MTEAVTQLTSFQQSYFGNMWKTSYFVWLDVFIHILAQRYEIVTQDFIEFFITFAKPYHPASKDSQAQWVNEVMGNSGINTKIFKLHSTRVGSNSTAQKLGMLLLEALKMGQWLNAATFTYYFREMKGSLDLDDQQHA